MQKFFPILLIGTLSMFFAEVFSGASQMWFIDAWGLLITFPLYLAHVLFFIWIALRIKKTSLSQLYLFGVIFALYESWITKVLWAGYINSTGPGNGTLFGIAISEFSILTFFWHPIMSFILPILVFEILSKKVLVEHEQIIRKTNKKTTLVIVFFILISTFIVNGNQFNLVSSNISLIGTLILISVFHYLSRTDLAVFNFNKKSFIVLSIYLTLLYIVFFLFLLPERIPSTIIHYIPIIIFYAVPIYLIIKSKKTHTELMTLNKNYYSTIDLIVFVIITILVVNVASALPNICMIILAITYFLLVIIGPIIFATALYKTLKKGV